MTPIPNHLSTLKPHHNRVGTTPVRAGEKKRAVWVRIEEKRRTTPQDKGRKNGIGSHCAHCEQGRESLLL